MTFCAVEVFGCTIEKYLFHSIWVSVTLSTTNSKSLKYKKKGFNF